MNRSVRPGVRWLAPGLVILLVAAACGGGDDGGPTISDARIGQPTGPNAALYLTASGYGEADSLISVETRVSPTAEIHETMMGDDGTMSMQPVVSLELPASGDLVLEPGGYHIMLIDVERLEVGDEVDVILAWEKAGNQTIKAEVVEPAATMDDMEGES
ncbi:MAG: copper chaperone PCu(A)C [Acidimicrobiia bacterium]|nr:copper chaperone PCu(A)C [Acidimicrobiia bacterium]MDH3462927.1 copper chaperone PCu(A)C [Acidimicrobiia bacterium]